MIREDYFTITSREILSFVVPCAFFVFNVFIILPPFLRCVYPGFTGCVSQHKYLIFYWQLLVIVYNGIRFQDIKKHLNHPADFRCRLYFVHGIDMYAVHAVFFQVSDLAYRIVDSGLAHIFFVTVCGD